jgi:hypothetical protein
MDSRRLLVWISACILLSWLYVERHGLPSAVDAAVSQGLSVLAGLALGGSVGGGSVGPGRGL